MGGKMKAAIGALAVVTLFLPGGVVSQTPVGCYQADAFSPPFASTPGGFGSPASQPTVATCIHACYFANFTHAGLQEGMFCLCGKADFVNGTTATDPTLASCNKSCSGDGLSCGGRMGWTTVYEAEAKAPTVKGLSIAVIDPTPPITVDKANVNLQVNVTTNRSLLNFYINIGDGSPTASFPGDNVSLIPITFSKPGSFIITVFAMFKTGTGFNSTARTKVVVEDPPTFNYTCPAIVDASTPIFCTLNQNSGTLAKLNAVWSRPVPGLTDNFTYGVPDPRYYAVGEMFASLATPTSAELGNSSDSGVFKIRSAFFDHPGVVTDVEAYVMATAPGASVIFSIYYGPTCNGSNSFCSIDNRCHVSTCSASCGATGNFCAKCGSCVQAGDSPAYAVDYSSASSVSLATTSVATVGTPVRVSVTALNIQVAAGGILAVDCQGACQLFYRSAKPGEQGDVNAASTADTRRIHFARAFVTNRTELLLAAKCKSSSENITTTLSLSSPAANTLPVTQPPQVTVCQTPIVNLSVTVSPLVAVNQDVNLTVAMSKGAPVDITIDWDTSNASVPAEVVPSIPNYTTPVPVPHTYATDGVYNIYILATNMLSGLKPDFDYDNVTTDVAVYFPVTDNWTLTATNLADPTIILPPGLVLFKLTYVGTAHLPTNATAVLHTGEGSRTLSMPVNSTTLNFSPYNYNSTGDVFPAWVNISNAYNWKIFNFEIAGTPQNITVWQAISNVSAEFRYITDTSSPIGLPGTGAQQLDFPMEWNVTVIPKVAEGVVRNYTLKWADNGTIIGSYNVTNLTNPNSEKIPLHLPQEGVYNVTLSACNKIQGCVPSNYTYSIRIVGKVVNVTIDDFRMIVPSLQNKSTQLLFESMGGSTCALVNYGDGTLEMFGTLTTCQSVLDVTSNVEYHEYPPLTNPMPLVHNYQRDGIYNMLVTAWNPISTASTSLNLIVADIPCLTPLAWITKPANGMTFKKAEPVLINGEARINCSLYSGSGSTIGIIREWQIYFYNETTGDAGDEVVIRNHPAVPSWNRAQLGVPGLFLEYGTYLLKFTATMTGLPIFDKYPVMRSGTDLLEISKSDLKVVMYDGGVSAILKASDGDFLVMRPGDLSSDPDDPEGKSNKTMTFEWSCARASEPPVDFDRAPFVTVPTSNTTLPTNDSGGCFGTGPGRLRNVMANRLVMSTSLLFRDNDTYRFSVRVSKDTRKGQASLEVQTQSGISPLGVSIGCKLATGCLPPSGGVIYMNQFDDFTAKASCIQNCDPFNPKTYEWTAYLHNPGDIYQAVDPIVKYLPYGNSSEELLLTSAFFDKVKEISPAWRFKMRALIRDTRLNSFGFSEYIFNINKPPRDGRCQCSGTDHPFIVLLTYHTCQCSGWSDPEGAGIASYQWITTREDKANMLPISYEPSDFPSHTMVLGVGTHRITCRITDKWGAVTVANVSVYPTANNMTKDLFVAAMEIPTKEQYDEFKESNMRSTLEVEMPSLLKQLDLAESQVLAEASWMALDTSSLSPDEVMSRVDQRIEQINSMLVNQGSQTNVLTKEQALTAGSVLGNVWGNINANSLEAGVVSIGSLKATESLMTSVDSLLQSQQVPLPDLTDLSRSVLSAANLGPVLDTLIDSGNCDEDPKPNLTFCRPLDMNQAVYDPFFPPLDIDKKETTNDTIERCCYLSEERRFRAAGVMKSIDSTLQTIAGEMVEQMVVGQSKEIWSSNLNSVMVVDKLTAGSVRGTNNELPFGVQVSIPTNMPCPGGDCQAGIGSSAIVHKNNILVGENVGAEQVTKNSPIVSIDFFDSGGNKIEVKNLNESIDLFIPREPVEDSQKMPFTCVNASAELANNSIKIIYSKVPPASASDSVFVEFYFRKPQSPIPNLYVLLGNGRQPTPIAGQYDAAIAVSDMDLDSSYGFYTATLQAKSVGVVDKTTAADSKKAIYIGVLQLKSGKTLERVANTSSFANFKENLQDAMFADYCMRTTCGGGFYHNGNQWANDGLETVSMDWTGMHMKTSHLSTFGAGFFVMPNTVDFNYVFAHAGFADNLTIYMTLIITVVVYLLILIWARFKDRKDVEKLGALSLPDNKIEHKYLYEITVLTGDQNSAMTDSKVSFIVSGENDESSVRTFGKPSKSRRRFFQKGQMDSFVMSCPRPLGKLNFLRIWHDCSGQGVMSSWFCTYLVIRDVQTDEKFEFIVNDWLALDEGDGVVDRLVPVAGDEQKREFSYLFNMSKSNNLRDEHLWFSVFMRPPQSRFTRVQRVSCCMALLYLSMLTNAMWYGTVKEQPSAGSMKFGPFSMGLEQIGVGFMANIIVLLPSMIIVTMFRRAGPRKLRKSRIDEALRAHGCLDESKPSEKTKKTKKYLLPWWFTIIAWILCIICMAVSVFFLWAYGIQFGNDKTSKWVSSLTISFFSSVLLIQTLKVLVLAFVFSAICKAESDVDDTDDDEEDPRLDYNEEYIDNSAPTKKRTIGFKPLDNEALRAAKIQRLREKMMWNVMKEIVFYTVYLSTMYVIATGNRDPNALLLKRHLVKTFIRPDAQDWNVMKIENENDFWNWTHNIVLKYSRAQNWYNGNPAYGLRGFMDDRTNRMMGYGIFRQVRIKENTCVVPRGMRLQNITHCSEYTEYLKEDHDDYCTMWRRPASFIPDSDCQWEEFQYKTAEELEALPIVGTLDSYTGGGYIIRLRGRDSELRERLKEAQRAEWTNHLTRAIFVEFSMYNANANLFGVATILFEAIPGGGLVPSYRFDGIRLLQYQSGFSMIVMIAEALFVIYTLYYTVVFFRGACKGGCAYLRTYWTMWESVQLILSFFGIGLYVYRFFLTKDILEKFEKTMGNGYIRMTKVNTVDSFLGYIIGILVFMGTITYLKLLRFNKRMGVLAETMRACWDDMIGFGVVFGIFFVGFVLMFYMFLNRYLFEWSNFVAASETSFAMLLGKLEFDDMKEANILAAVIFFFYAIAMALVMINIFFTIVINAFEEVKKEMAKKPDELEIVEYMKHRIGAFVGVKKVNTVNPVQVEILPSDAEGNEDDKKKITQFPNKVDRMLDHINSVFFNGDVDIHNKAWLKKMAKQHNFQQQQFSDI